MIVNDRLDTYVDGFVRTNGSGGVTCAIGVRTRSIAWVTAGRARAIVTGALEKSVIPTKFAGSVFSLFYACGGTGIGTFVS